MNKQIVVNIIFLNFYNTCIYKLLLVIVLSVFSKTQLNMNLNISNKTWEVKTKENI